MGSASVVTFAIQNTLQRCLLLVPTPYMPFESLCLYGLASDSYTTRMHILQEGYNSITAALCSLSEVWLATDLARIEAAG